MTEENKPYRIYKDFSNETQVGISGSQSTEPALKVGGSVSAFMAALMGLISVVNPNFMSSANGYWILLAFTVLLPVATTVLTRSFVWSPASVMQLARDIIEAAGTVKKPGEKKLPF